MTTCYYRILGVSVRATAEEVKRAFRLLALRFHPDRNPDDPEAIERFRQALEAYETLVDPSRRRTYDRGRGYAVGRPRANRTGVGGNRNRGRSASVREVVEEYFGVSLGQRETVSRCPDLRFDLEVARSATRVTSTHLVEYVREVFCTTCLGRGATNGKGTCAACGGTGRAEELLCIRITLPPDCRDGLRVRMAGAGDRTTRGLPAGDLVVYVQVIEGL